MKQIKKTQLYLVLNIKQTNFKLLKKMQMVYL